MRSGFIAVLRAHHQSICPESLNDASGEDMGALAQQRKPPACDDAAAEIERLHRQKIAFEYYSARKTLREGDEENRLIGEELNLESNVNRLRVGDVMW